jgi:hypothetical protein
LWSYVGISEITLVESNAKNLLEIQSVDEKLFANSTMFYNHVLAAAPEPNRQPIY